MEGFKSVPGTGRSVQPNDPQREGDTWTKSGKEKRVKMGDGAPTRS